jgi:hypothetical protein
VNSLSTETAQLVGGFAIGGAVIVAFLIGGDVTSALISGALVIGFVLLVHFGRRRSQSLEVMSGMGDERTRQLYLRATAFAGSVMRSCSPAGGSSPSPPATRT